MCAGPLRNGDGALAGKALRSHVFEGRVREAIAVAFTRTDAGEDVPRSSPTKPVDVGLRLRTRHDDRIQCGGHQPKNVRIVEVA
jgi:hypothetical protein